MGTLEPVVGVEPRTGLEHLAGSAASQSPWRMRRQCVGCSSCSVSTYSARSRYGLSSRSARMNTVRGLRVVASTNRPLTQACPRPPGFDAERMRIGTGMPASRRSLENRNRYWSSGHAVSSSMPMNWNCAVSYFRSSSRCWPTKPNVNVAPDGNVHSLRPSWKCASVWSSHSCDSGINEPGSASCLKLRRSSERGVPRHVDVLQRRGQQRRRLARPRRAAVERLTNLEAQEHRLLRRRDDRDVRPRHPRDRVVLEQRRPLILRYFRAERVGHRQPRRRVVRRRP